MTMDRARTDTGRSPDTTVTERGQSGDTARVARGSLTGSMVARTDRLPAMRGAVTVERELLLQPGDHLRIAGWVREAGGVPFLSLVIESAGKGGRR